MENIEAFIQAQRKMGKADEQIKEVLRAGGWTDIKLQQYFPIVVPVSSGLVKPSKKLLWIFLILGFLVFEIGSSVFAWNYTHSSKKVSEPNLTTMTPTPSPQKTGNIMVAFVQSDSTLTRVGDNNINLGFIRFYDLSTKKELSPDPILSQAPKTLPSLGNWSPDGRYLPILLLGSANVSESLYVFDATTQKAKKLTELSDTTEFPGFSTSFWFQSFWIDPTHVAAGINMGKPSPSSDTLLVVDTSGTVTKSTRPATVILGTQRLTYELNQTIATASGVPAVAQTVTAVKIDGKQFQTSLQGTPFGLIGNQLVTAIIPTAQNPYTIAPDAKFTKQYEEATTEEERTRLMNDFLRPKQEATVSLYDIAKGTLSRSIPISAQAPWYTASLQMRPQHNTIIVNQQDSVVPPYAYRFLEFNPTTKEMRTIVQTSRYTAIPQLAMNTVDTKFTLSADGNWLLYYEQTNNPAFPPALYASIVATHIDTGEKVLVCKDGCNFFKVYNPDQIVRR